MSTPILNDWYLTQTVAVFQLYCDMNKYYKFFPSNLITWCNVLWLQGQWYTCTLMSVVSVLRGRRGRNRMVVGFTATYATSAYHHWCCEFESRSGRDVQHYVLKFVSDLRQVGGFLRVIRIRKSTAPVVTPGDANPTISQERVKITYLTDTRNKFRKRKVNQTILHESRSI
jgi:hypothetical protein